MNTADECLSSTAPFFSIIMPVYGVRDYIANAIECVQNQSFQDWELIVVDDCSTDGSGEIAQAYAESDSRIRVVRHSQNQGLSAARNTGLSEARGAYVWMPDSDDSFSLDLLECAYGALANNLPNVAMFGYVEDYYDAEGKFLYENKLPMSAGCYESPQDWHPLVIGFERDTHYGYAWNKVYKLSCINALDLRFERVRLIEDITFNVAFFQGVQSLVVLPGIPYRYAKRQGRSLTNANAFSAREYYALHRRRIEMLKDQFVSWGVLDDRCREILGGLYGRYVLSTLERLCFPGEGLSSAQRRERSREIFGDPLFKELIPLAQAEKSKSLKFCLGVMRTKSPLLSIALARVIYFVHVALYPVFTKLRSGR